MFKFPCLFPISNSCISLTFILARFKSSTDDRIFVSGFCKCNSCNCSLSYSVKQQSRSTGDSGSTSSCELFHAKVDKAYNALWVEYPLHRGGKYNFPRFCNVNWNFLGPRKTVNTSVFGTTYNHSLLKCNCTH